jgi:hypothetical protein
VAGSLTRREGAAEEAVQHRAGGSLDEGQLVCALDLSLDLGLADDHRLQPGCDAEEVAGGVGSAQGVEGPEQLGGANRRLARDHAERGGLGLDGVGGDEIDLGAVAGGDRDALADRLLADEGVQHAGRLALGQREALAQRQGRGLVGDAEREQAAHGELPDSRFSPSAASASSRSSRWMRCSFIAMIAT